MLRGVQNILRRWRKLRGGRADRRPPPEYATVYTYMYVKVQPTCSLGRIYVYIMYIFTKNTNCYI